MKRILFLLCCLFCSAAYSQDTIPVQKRIGVERSYVSLIHFKTLGIELTKEDSLNFRYHNNDTLVLIRPGIDLAPANGVRVRYQPKDSLFLKIYEDVVFGMDREEERKSTLKLWREEVKIYFDSTVPQVHRGYLMNFASEISTGIDSLKISEVPFPQDANYTVFFRNDSTATDPDPRITNDLAGYYVNWNGRQELTKGALKINAFRIPSKMYQITLLKWHFLKSLGYFGYSDKLDCQSYLSECSQAGPISDKDLEILKYHYSYSNCIGNDRESFNSFHENARETLEKDPNAEIYVIHH